MTNYKYSILFIGFNRSELFKRSFKKLISIFDASIFVHIDGPRNENDEYEQRKIFNFLKKYKTHIKKTKLQNKNLGCKKGVIYAINWAFKFTDNLIIVEDDIIVSNEFKKLVNSWISDYYDFDGVFGWNVKSNLFRKNHLKIYKTNLFRAWGWSVKKDTWFAFYNSILKNNILSKNIYNFSLNRKLQIKIAVLSVLNEDVDTWDYLFFYHILINEKNFLVPTYPTTGNIGNIQSTHKVNVNNIYGYPDSKIKIRKQLENNSLKIKKIENLFLDGAFGVPKNIILLIFIYIKLNLKYFLWKKKVF